MTELAIEKDTERISDTQYEQYNELMGKVALIGYAVMDTATLLAYEVTKNQLSESMAKLAIFATILGATPMFLGKLHDKIKSTK